MAIFEKSHLLNFDIGGDGGDDDDAMTYDLVGL